MSLRGKAGALASYGAFVDGVAARYLALHARAYADEARWVSSPFWARHRPAVAALSGVLTPG